MLSKFYFSTCLVFILLATLAGGAAPVKAAGSVFYAAPIATGVGNCSSWENACSLQTALAGASSGDEIWVKAGVHKPTTDTTDRTATFQLKDGVAVYGGFAGIETTRDQRDPATNLTVLSGDIDNNDSQTPVITDLTTVTGNTTNSYHVLKGAAGATLDGFTITGGYANGSSPDNNGGGLHNTSTSLTLANVTFSGNSVNNNGGGIYNDGTLVVTDSTFSRNFATIYGASSGGAVYNYGTLTITNSTLFGNSATYGGGLSNFGALTVTNSTLSGNRADWGSGINNYGMLTLTNSTLSGNPAASEFSLYNHSTLNYANTIIANSTMGDCAQYGTIGINSNNLVEDGSCSASLSGDPNLGPLVDNGGPTQTFALLPGSSAIDAGDDTLCPASDQRGVSRPQRAQCDIGAYEYDYTGIYYTKPAASGIGDCQSWVNACSLQTALAGAISGDEIWVRAGVHYPGSNRTDTFALQSGMALYGGFAGSETARDQRNPVVNITVLSGDIDGNDINTDGNFIAETWNDIQGANAYHIVTGSGTDGTAVLDGFTITAGYSSDDPLKNRGAGMYNNHGSPALKGLTFIGNSADEGGGMSNENSSHPALNTVTFSGNRACNGGGLFNLYSDPTLSNVTFDGNWVEGDCDGGGMYNYASNPVLTHVIFHGNHAGDWGGGMVSISSNPVLTDVTFSDNIGGSSGGGMSNWDGSASLTDVTFSGNSTRNWEGGGLYNSNSTVSLTNVTFRGNHAGNAGGGIYHGGGFLVMDQALFSVNSAVGSGGGIVSDGGNLTLTNVTFSNNSAGDGGGGMANANNSPILSNILMWGNTAPNGGGIWNIANSTSHISYSDIQGCNPGGVWNSACGKDGGGNLPDADPLFVDPAIGDLHLQFTSPAIDTGTNTGCPATDLDGIPRPQGNACDIGAYEVQKVLMAVQGGQTSGLCEIWANACELQYALTSAVSGQEIWVAAGTYKPTTGTDRTATFQLKNGVGVYGGFAGTETAREQRDWVANVTILSGDLNGDDNSNVLWEEPTRADNSSNVVIGATGATLDGFTITAGNANGTDNKYYGGGMYNMSSNPTLANITFSNNSAKYYGGGMYIENSSPMLTNVNFSGNDAANSGGGVYNHTSNTSLTDVTFNSNSATWGGGLHNVGGSPILTNVTFDSNSAQYAGGMYTESGSPILMNATFTGNSAVNDGGGMYNHTSNPTLTNVTFSGNSANSGGGIYNELSNPMIQNNILWGNSGGEIYNNISTTTVTDSVIEGGYAGGTNIITADPLLGVLGDHGGFTQTIPLLPGSSAIDATSSYCPATDQRGEARSIPNCDIGAFESQGFSLVITSGNNQRTLINHAFTNPLVVGVTSNNAVEPVNGGLVTFIAPVSGASAVLTGSPATISSGSASVTATANGTSGAYQVSASGAGTDVNFTLTNTTFVTFRSVGANDGWILESSETSNVGGTLDSASTTFNLGDGAGDKQYRAILSFKTDELPDTAVITKVTLKIRKQGLVGTNPFTILGGLKVDMRKPYFGTTVGLLVSDFQAAAGRIGVATFGATPVNNWYSALLNAAGRAYVNKTGTTQFRLYFAKDDNDDNGADYMKFFSGNYATASARPTLIIEYYIP